MLAVHSASSGPTFDGAGGSSLFAVSEVVTGTCRLLIKLPLLRLEEDCCLLGFPLNLVTGKVADGCTHISFFSGHIVPC